MGDTTPALDDTLWDEVLALHTHVERALAKALQRGHALALSEFRALDRLASAEHGSIRMQELADSIGLNQSSVSRLVARLEESGLSARDICLDDRRGVYSMITDAGRDRHAAAATTYTTTLRAALDQAAADPRFGATVEALRSRTADR